MANYSFLTSDSKIILDCDRIESMLQEGTKVLLFGTNDILNTYHGSYAAYVSAKLLQLFPCSGSFPVVTIEDGFLPEETKHTLQKLALKAPAFNHEQYLIEHADADNSVIVEAGAGTGKTTVMIDRILFLLHTVPNLSMDEIGVITFTNEATQNMKHKLQKALIQRYRATKSPRYLQFLENSSKIQIQTIHSFSKDIINELGSSIGYAHSLGLKSYKYEKKQIIHDVLNQRYLQNKRSLSKSLGAQLHELDRLITNFWSQLDNLGLTDEEIAALDWGRPADSSSSVLHNTLSGVFTDLNDQYNILKMEEDSIAVGDIVRELRRILDSGTDLVIHTKKLKYLFVDEFQDSDNAQIKTIAWLHRVCNLKLFAVGDTKQSIYRFRGAVETAFDRLRHHIAQNTDLVPNSFPLTRNYRTSKDVLDSLHPIFTNMKKNKLLDYNEPLIPQKTHHGHCEMKRVRKAQAVYKYETIKTLRDMIEDCKAYAEANDKMDDPTQHVTVLARTNFQIAQIGQWCAEEGVPCYIKREGTFYSSQAVIDFFCLVKAFVFPNSAIHLCDYIHSSYSSVDIDFQKLSQLEPQSKEQISYLQTLLDQNGWSDYQKRFRLKPALSVLREIIDIHNPAERYIAKRRQMLEMDKDWLPDQLNTQLKIDAEQYIANIEKLLQILRERFSGEMASLYHIYSFLQIQIAANKTEDEPDISENIGCGCVHGMTVHKAKGLEFDTVLVPLTHRVFRKPVNTELILDERSSPTKVGWSYVEFEPGTWDEVKSQQCNNYYEECLDLEFDNVDREEARLLYVALTRAIRRLEYFIIGDEPHTWAHMLEV